MEIEGIIDKLGKNFDEIRQNVTGGFMLYLVDGRRFGHETFRGALEEALEAINANEKENS